MNINTQFDLIIIGAGPGGYVAAQRAAALGMQVVVIEKHKLGGTCLNRGCIPTKALIYASTLYQSMRACEQFGLTARDVGFDPVKMNEYKAQTVRKFRSEVASIFKENHILLVHGTATILRQRTVRVIDAQGKESIYTAPHILIATGAVPGKINQPGADLPGVVNSRMLLHANEWTFRRLAILGGGVVGIEFANIFNALGCEVTVIETRDRLLASMDSELSENLQHLLAARGIRIYTNATLNRIEKGADGLVCHFEQNGEAQTAICDRLLTAVGRTANTEDLFAPGCDVNIENGRIVVDNDFRTSLPGVYAIGDVIGRIQLAHLASAEGIYAVERMNNLRPSIMLTTIPSCSFVELPIVPSCIYINPEIATVGISEDAARRYGMAVRCGRYVMSGNGKTIISKEDPGMIKLLFEAHSNMLVGAQMMCSRATDMIGEMATAVANGLTSEQLMYAMRAHPTYNEAVSEAVRDSQK